MEIEIYADVACPWCYIGKRRLEEALESYNGPVTVRYRPFQLDPSPVPEPRPLVEALGAKFGGAERAREMFAHVTQVAADAGIQLDFERAVASNTFDAHRLAWYVEHLAQDDRPHERVGALLDVLYRAHFTDGVDLGSRDALATLATEVGLDATEVRAFLDSRAGVAEVAKRIAGAREIGVTSVPTFVLAGRYAVTGAQEPETLRAALAEVARREAE